MERLYTMIMDFRSGTYISQIKANNEKDALIKGISNLNPQHIEFFGKKIQQKMLNEALNEEPVAIADNQNVFMVGLSPMGHFTAIHIILTELTSE